MCPFRKILDGISDSYASSAHFNHVKTPSANNSSAYQQSQQRQYLSSGYYFHPRGSIRETSVRVDSGQDGPTEWSRREESFRETGESRMSHTSDHHTGRFIASPTPPSQHAHVNGFNPLPPVPTLSATHSGSPSFRVTRKPTVTRNGDSEVVITEEMKKEDDISETIIQRRTIRRSEFGNILKPMSGELFDKLLQSSNFYWH